MTRASFKRVSRLAKIFDHRVVRHQGVYGYYYSLIDNTNNRIKQDSTLKEIDIYLQKLWNDYVLS